MSHAALVHAIVRTILSPLQPHAPSMTTHTAISTAAHGSALVPHHLFSVPLWILPVPSRILSFTFLYVVEEKEPDWSQGQNLELGLCEEWVLNCLVRNFILFLCWRKWLRSMNWEGTHQAFFLGSVLVPTRVTYPKWRGFTRGDGSLSPLSSSSHSLYSQK